MKRLITPLLLLLCTLCTEVAAQPSTNIPLTAIDMYFSRLEAFGLSGSLLVGNHSEILLKKNYGNTTFPNDVDPAYTIASLMKQFTAVAILTLEEQGLLNTDDEIGLHLPNIPKDKSQITIHQLLTHTSGLGDAYWDAKENRDLNLAAFVQKILTEDFIYPPGQEFSYSNFGYDILSHIIAVKTNKPRIQFLVEELFQPNGMNHTGHQQIKWKKNQVAAYEDWAVSSTDLKLSSNPLDWPFRTMLSTTSDLYRWHQLLFHSKKLLTAASKEKLLSVEKSNYAYGWKVRQTRRGTKLVYHGGYDSWLGMVTGFYHFVEEDLLVIFLGNTNMNETLHHEYLMQEVEAIVFGGYAKLPPAAQLAEAAPTVDPYVGNYKNEKSNVQISKGRLNQQIKLSTTDSELILQLLFPKADEYASTRDEQLEFVLDQFNKGEYEPLRSVFFEGLFERFKVRYSEYWKQLTAAYGAYKDMKIIHRKPLIFGSDMEQQIFTQLIFENGVFYIRLTRIQNGRIALHPIHFPKRLELYFVPKGNSEWMSWSIKYDTAPVIRLEDSGLKINGGEIVYRKD